MNSQPTDIPEFARGDSVRARTMNHIASITKTNSNNSVGAGMHSYSTSSGIAHNISIDVSKKPIWAMIIGIQQYFPVPHAASPGNEDEVLFVKDYYGNNTKRLTKPNYAKGCQHYVFRYTWSPLTEDRDLNRHGSEIFGGFIHEWPAYQVPNQKFNKSSEPGGLESIPTGFEPLIYYPTTCRAMTFSTDYGPKYYSERAKRIDEGYDNDDKTSVRPPSRVSDLPLYEVNNSRRPLGYIGKIFYGMGNYMFMTSTFAAYKAVIKYPPDPPWVVQDPDRCCDGVDWLDEGGFGGVKSVPPFYQMLNDSYTESVKEQERAIEVFNKGRIDNVKYFMRTKEWRDPYGTNW